MSLYLRTSIPFLIGRKQIRQLRDKGGPPASESPGSGEKILCRGLEFAQKLLSLLMESHPSGDPLRRGKRTTQNRTPNPSFTFFREYRTPEMKRQTRFCRLFTVCLFAASVNVVTNRKLTSYNAFLHRKVTKPPSAGKLFGKIPQRKQTVKPKRRTLALRLNRLFASDLHGRA